MKMPASRWSDLLVLICILVFCIGASPDLYERGRTLALGVQPWASRLPIWLLMAGAWLVSVLMLAAAASSRPVIKWPIFALVCASFMSMAAYRQVARKAMEYPDYLILWQARANTLDAVEEYAASALLPLGFIALLAIGFVLARRRRWASRWAVALFCMSAGIFAVACMSMRGGATNDLPTTTGLYGFVIADVLDRQADETYVYVSSDRPEHAARAENIVLVVDESIRHDFFHRVVGPGLLADTAGRWYVHDFGLATSMANCSGGSNAMLRKGVRSDRIAEDMYRRPLIWSYAHNAGFTSYLLDVQRNGVGHDYFDEVERGLIDHRVDVRDLRKDADVLNAMSYLSERRKTFSLVIKRGAHFPYVRHVPKGFHAQGAASEHSYVVSSQKSKDYVNVLSWQTAGFFDKLLTMSVPGPTMVIYTSDHGQNVDDQPGLTHCTASAEPYVGEGLVPLVILTNYPDPRLAQAAAHNRNLLSHFNIAPTVLDAMGYESSRWYAPPDAAVTVPQSAPVAGFVYGSPFGYFGHAVQIAPVDRNKALGAVRERWER